MQDNGSNLVQQTITRRKPQASCDRGTCALPLAGMRVAMSDSLNYSLLEIFRKWSGRMLMARERDATDAVLTTSFGARYSQAI